MTDGVLATVEQWTGDKPISCPWRAFWDPFVQRVLEAEPWFDKGQLAILHPRPSHRLVAGITHLTRARARVRSKRWEQEQERREQQSRAREAHSAVSRGIR